MAGDESAKARLSLKFAQTRLEEMNELTSIDQERAGLAINGYKNDLAAAFRHIRQITDTSIQTNLLIQASENMQNQLAFCDSVIDGNPTSSEPVNRASNLAINQQVHVLEMLSYHDNLQAAQMNFEAMENRIQRAQSKAGSAQYLTMQEVLLQYQQFTRLGEQILHNAQSSNNNITEIETLSIQSLSSHLDILDSISQNVPLEYQESIENCRQLTKQLENQARHRYQGQGNPDKGPDSGADESVSGTDEPGTNSNESGAKSGEPGRGAGETNSDADEPGSGAGEPGNGMGELSSGSGEPDSGSGESGNNPGNSGNSTGGSS